MVRTFRTEFPAFDVCPQAVQLLAAGFSDESWHNDACPSFHSPDGTRRVWADFADADLRDSDAPRFGVQALDGEEAGEYLLSTDSWAEVCALLGLPVPSAVQMLASQFALSLLGHIGAEALEQVRAANDEPGVCSSHNHCDANMVMQAAFEAVFGRDPYMPSDVEEGLCTERQADADLAAWNDAWNLAKRAGLPTDRLPV